MRKSVIKIIDVRILKDRTVIKLVEVQGTFFILGGEEKLFQSQNWDKISAQWQRVSGFKAGDTKGSKMLK